ncbi:hypothetical protein pb186bvf_010248 [Paramecium bursaria]
MEKIEKQFFIDRIQQQLELCEKFVKLHLAMSLIGFITFTVRRIPIILVINFLSVMLALFGNSAFSELKKNYIIIYSVCTSSLFGMFLIYQILAALFQDSYETEAPSQSIVMLLFSLPYIIDLTSGLLGLRLSYELLQLNGMDIIRKYDKLVIDEFQISQEAQDSDQCVICFINPKDTIFYKCGHKAACYKCSSLFRNGKCPICRGKIIDIIQQFDV